MQIKSSDWMYMGGEFLSSSVPKLLLTFRKRVSNDIHNYMEYKFPVIVNDNSWFSSLEPHVLYSLWFESDSMECTRVEIES
jgi:hypothetical protein